MKRIRTVVSAVFLFQCLVSARAYSGTEFVTVATDDRGIVLEFNASGYGFMDVLEDGIPCTRITLPGATIDSRPGLPVLPLKSTWIAVPQGEPPSVTVLNVAFETRQDTWVALGPGPAGSGKAAEGSAPERIPRNKAVYGPDAWFPEPLVEVKPEGLLRGLPVARLTVHPVQVLPTLGQARSYSRIRFRVDFAGMPERRVRQAGELASDAYDSALWKEVVNWNAVTVVEEDPAARDFPGSAEDPLSAFTVMEEEAGSGVKVKISVDKKGVHAIQYLDLKLRGYDPSRIDPRYLHLTNKGREIPMIITGETDGVWHPGDTLIFFGTPEDGRYTGTNVYWLWLGTVPGARMGRRAAAPGGTAPVFAAYRHRVLVEENRIYVANTGGAIDHWYWERADNAPTEREIPFIVNHISPQPGTARLRVSLLGRTETNAWPDHHVVFYLNGQRVGEAWWDGLSAVVQDFSFSRSLLLEGENRLLLRAPGDTGGAIDSFYTNGFELEYDRTYAAVQDSLLFTGEGRGRYRFCLDGFVEGVVEVYDITDPHSPVQLTGLQIRQTASGHTAEFEVDLDRKRDFVALAPGRREVPYGIELDAGEAGNLLSPSRGADYIVITTDTLQDAARILATHREARGLRTEVVTVDAICNAFNFGIFSPYALRDFLRYAYENWAPPAPLYAVLFGDANLDFRDYLGSGFTDQVPPFLVDRGGLGEIPTDHPYACVSGEDSLPDLLIGRISVRKPEDAEDIVEKLIAYERLASDSWMRKAVFSTDYGASFMADTDALIRRTVPEHYRVQKIYLDESASGTRAHLDLMGALNGGAVLTSYMGHSTMDHWSLQLLKDSQLGSLENTGRYTFAVMIGCNTGYFAEPFNKYSIAETFLHYGDKGGIGSLSPVASSYVTSHVTLVEAFLRGLFRDRNTILGSAVAAAKISAALQHGVEDYVLENYEFFGDPALALRVEDPARDEDRDGRVNRNDNCPLRWNTGQEDADMDGAGDLCDNCPDTYNPDQADRNNDGAGDACDGTQDPEGWSPAAQAAGISGEAPRENASGIFGHVLSLVPPLLLLGLLKGVSRRRARRRSVSGQRYGSMG